jgi:hypothetical protein
MPESGLRTAQHFVDCEIDETALMVGVFGRGVAPNQAVDILGDACSPALGPTPLRWWVGETFDPSRMSYPSRIEVAQHRDRDPPGAGR